jgi:hypothetical protein
MALTIAKQDLPGYKTAQAIYKVLPGGGAVKKLVIGATAGALALGAIAAGGVGIAALIGATGGSLLGSTLLAAGIIAALPFVFRFIANTARTLYSFNWNMSDDEIKNSLNSSISGLYSQLGEAAGTAVGWITCGILPGVVTFAFNPGLAKLVMADMTAEAQEEIWGSIAACQNSAIALLGRALMLNGYKSARRWLKRPDSPFYGFLKKHFGESFTKWGDSGQPAFTFSSQVEERIEQIPDENWRNFTEEFVESLMDSCTEALENLGDSMKTHMSAYAMMRRQECLAAQSASITVEVDFSRDDTE